MSIMPLCMCTDKLQGTGVGYSAIPTDVIVVADATEAATAMNGFSLKNINGSVGGFYA